MSEGEPPDIIGWDDSSFEEFVAGSSARLFTTARLLTGARLALARLRGPAGVCRGNWTKVLTGRTEVAERHQFFFIPTWRLVVVVAHCPLPSKR